MRVAADTFGAFQLPKKIIFPDFLMFVRILWRFEEQRRGLKHK